MLYDIKVQRHETYNCFDENVISIICQCYKKEMDIYFLNDFGFSVSSSICNENQFKISTSCDIGERILSEHLGIKLKIVSKEDLSYSDFCDLLQRELETKGLIGISLDSYSCPWNKKYFRIIHMDHYSMIIHEDKGKCVCVDPYFDLEQHVLDNQELCDVVESFVLIEIGEQHINYDAIREIHREALLKQKGKRKEEIVNYAQSILALDSDEMNRIIDGDINASGLVFALNNMRNARCNYRKALQIYGNQLGIGDEIDKEMSVLCRKWEKVKSLCIMAIYKKKNKYLEAAAKVLCDIAYDEEKIIDYVITNN